MELSYSKRIVRDDPNLPVEEASGPAHAICGYGIYNFFK